MRSRRGVGRRVFRVRSLPDTKTNAFHDFLPTNWKEQHIPRIQSNWTGDCWKLAIELSKAIGVDFYIVNILAQKLF